MVNVTANEIAGKILADLDLAKKLSEPDIRLLLEQTRIRFQKMKICTRVDTGSALIVGDIHGDFEILKKIVKTFLLQKIDNLIFLGDIVDRGSQSIACVNLLFSLILTYPKRVFIVRGNHESSSVNSRYGFIDEVRQYGGSMDLYEAFNETFSYMPLSLIHNKFKIFFVHGGLPINTLEMSVLEKLPKGDKLLENATIMQMLWNDPKEDIERYSYSMRGGGIYTFGEELVDEFLKENNLRMIIRAHEAFSDGYKYFFNKKLLSIFTSEEYYSFIQAKIALIDSNGIIKLAHPADKLIL